MDFVSGQIDAQRVAIVTLFLAAPDTAKALATFRELHQHLQDDLLSKNVPDAHLEGIAAEVRAIEGLLGQANS